MRPYGLAPAIVVLGLLAIPLPSFAAVEHRQVGDYEMTVGWVEEPAYAGFRNAIVLRLHDRGGRPVLDLGDTLKVEVGYGRDKSEAVPLIPAFSDASGRKGEYRLPLIPTRPGAYTFHFVGTIKDQRVDESFTGSEETFNLVQSASQLEFPVKDPTREELALRIQRMGPRIDKLHDSVDTIKRLAAVGLGIGLAGLIAALAVARTQRSH